MTSVQTWENFQGVGNMLEMPDVPRTDSAAMQSQYSVSRRIGNLGKTFYREIDATAELESMKSYVYDMDTAKGLFMDWWGERIGVARYIKVNGEYVRLDDDYYRFLLFYRARANFADGTAKTMNELLSSLTDTRTFVVDYQMMNISSVVIIGAIPDLQATILATYGLINRPAGVMANYLIIYPDEQIFGFEGSNLCPFDQGVFNPGRNIPIT